jgi:hypothetical protein
MPVAYPMVTARQPGSVGFVVAGGLEPLDLLGGGLLQGDVAGLG